MQIGLNTDYCRSTGNPAPWLKAMAEAGFSHVHWCHQWNTDFGTSCMTDGIFNLKMTG